MRHYPCKQYAFPVINVWQGNGRSRGFIGFPQTHQIKSRKDYLPDQTTGSYTVIAR